MMIVLYGPWCNKTQNWLIEMSIFIDPLDSALHLWRQLTEKSFIVSDGYFSWYIEGDVYFSKIFYPIQTKRTKLHKSMKYNLQQKNNNPLIKGLSGITFVKGTTYVIYNLKPSTHILDLLLHTCLVKWTHPNHI